MESTQSYKCSKCPDGQQMLGTECVSCPEGQHSEFDGKIHACYDTFTYPGETGKCKHVNGELLDAAKGAAPTFSDVIFEECPASPGATDADSCGCDHASQGLPMWMESDQSYKCAKCPDGGELDWGASMRCVKCDPTEQLRSIDGKPICFLPCPTDSEWTKGGEIFAVDASSCSPANLADPDLQPYEIQMTPIASSPLSITDCPSGDYATTSEPWRPDLCGCSDDYGPGGDGGFRYDHVSGQGGCSRGCEGGQREESLTCYAACDEVPVFDTLLCESHAGKIGGW